MHSSINVNAIAFNREAVAFQSPGLRRQPLPWEQEIEWSFTPKALDKFVTRSRCERENGRNKSETPSGYIYDRTPVTQGALRDPGLRSLTPSA
jgi:hypothetical protein